MLRLKNGSDVPGARWQSAALWALAAAWSLLLVSPAASAWYFAEGGDQNPALAFAASVCILLGAWLLVPPRVFLACSYPFAVIAASIAVADLFLDLNLLQIAAQWRAFSPGEVMEALRPYIAVGIGAALALAVVAALLGIAAGKAARRGRVLRWTHAAVLACILLLVPESERLRAWPLNAVFVTGAVVLDMPVPGSVGTTSMESNPRSAASSWGATREGGGGPQTYVLLISDAVRPDYLKECGGPDRMQALRGGAIVACDVTAGADQTIASVPLLVSRDLPGHAVRVSADSTFQHGFAEAGFATYWFATQPEVIAWPDAATKAFLTGPDALLFPLMDQALATGTQSSIVLHTVGAHSPYCDRFDARTAPYPDVCARIGAKPTLAAVADWRAMYANGVDASIRFANAVIERLERQQGEAFLVITSDHGENLLDDTRLLSFHALRKPTRWDAQVPAIFWANAAWKAAHPDAWQMLQANARRPLMHADLVPTLLAAADIAYRDKRRLPVNLLAEPVAPRERFVEKALQVRVGWQTLLRDAEQSAFPRGD